MATAGRARSGGSRVKVVKVSKKEVQQLLNGQPTGVVIPESRQTIGSVAMEMARSNGLKTYSILVDGTKVTTEGASKPLAGHRSIEIFAKETRGSALFSITSVNIQSLENGL